MDHLRLLDERNAPRRQRGMAGRKIGDAEIDDVAVALAGFGAESPSGNATLTAIWRNFLRFRCSRTQCTLRSGSRKSRQPTRQSAFSNGL
jgi:hypothetical protein